MSSVPDSTSSGRGAMRAAMSRCSIAPSWPGITCEPHMFHGTVCGAPTTTGSRRPPRPARARRARRGRACTCRRTRARRRDPSRVDERCAQHVERAPEVPEVALERHDAGHRRAHEIPVAVVLVVGHPVAALAEAAQVGREHDVAERREHVRVVVARAARLDAAHERLARAVPVDREHGGPGGVAARGDEEIRGHRHRLLDVEHDPRPRIVAAVDLLGGLEVERDRRRVRAQPGIELGPGAPATRRRPRGATAAAAATCSSWSRQYAQLEKLRVRLTPARRAPSRARPARWRRYAGDSHAAGK